MATALAVKMSDVGAFYKILHQSISVRAKVIATLEMVQQGYSLATLLDGLLNAVPPNDKGFAHELTVGTLRHWWAICRISESLVEKEITDKGVLAGLNIGIYQLLYLQTPDYASIFATVEALKELNKGYGTGLVNAILRKVAKNPAKFFKKINKNHSLPNHLAKALKQDWAEQYQTLGQVLREPAPMFLRANTAKISHEDYKILLQNHGIEFCEVCLNSQSGVQSNVQSNTQSKESGADDNQETYHEQTQAFKITPQPVQNLPKFDEGFVAVQDLHAQLAVSIMDTVLKLKIRQAQTEQTFHLLDACTAPAGKLTHWLAHLSRYNKESDTKDEFHVKPNFCITAIDNDDTRLNRVFDNLQRLGFLDKLNQNLWVKTADATDFQSSEPFDFVMLDAPCTATGVIRRHPDIALLRQESDIANTVQLQAMILDNLWQSVAKGGYLLYITCSILKAENEAQMLSFLTRHPDACECVIEADWGIKQQVGRQCLPMSGGGDGFYYALIQKSA